MKTKYKKYNESLRSKIIGKSENELIKALDNLSDSEKVKRIITLGLSYDLLPDKRLIVGDLRSLPGNLTSLPDDLIINGNLYCENCELISLPKNLTVRGDLYCDYNNLPNQLNKLPQETIKEYVKRYNGYYYNYNATKITKFFKNVILAPKRAVQILLAKSVENFYYSPDCKVMMKIREKQWQKYFK